MHQLKRIFGALFVGILAYILAVVTFVAVDSGLRTNVATGAGVLLAHMSHPITVGSALVAFVVTLSLSSRA